jgi:hypothetical protein
MGRATYISWIKVDKSEYQMHVDMKATSDNGWHNNINCALQRMYKVFTKKYHCFSQETPHVSFTAA